MPAAIAKPKKAELTRWRELEQQRVELKRQSDAVTREQKLLAEQFEPWARQETAGLKQREVVLYGCVLRVVEKIKSVRWKDAFIRLAGADAAVELQTEAGTSETFEIAAV